MHAESDAESDFFFLPTGLKLRFLRPPGPRANLTKKHHPRNETAQNSVRPGLQPQADLPARADRRNLFCSFCGNLSFGRASVHRHDRPTPVVFIFNVQHQLFRPAGGAARPWRVNHGSSQLQRNLRRLWGVDPGRILIFDIFDSVIFHFSPDMAEWLFELSLGFLAELFSISFGIISQQHGALIKNNQTQLQHARS